MATLIKRNFISSPSLSNLPLDCISIIILRTNFKSTRSLTIFQFQREISVKLFCKRGLRNRFEYPIHYRIKWLESTVAGDSVISWVSLEMVPARACSSSPSNGELLGYWKGNNVSHRRIFLSNKFSTIPFEVTFFKFVSFFFFCRDPRIVEDPRQSNSVARDRNKCKKQSGRPLVTSAVLEHHLCY